ncbi:Hypothetical Protein FCC1311_045622 [Hondaea fermentalgiana]|uniref:Uncharacterized protein n=1 Tax=Hondaea fermentalgiana TaxID=2315210 RepID=A0A2R5GDE8_9STRA|nr:Hypothetical Protein FCC1311_045622 [Hondaea fermentalgiana]|eukprot:GBG28339.1 Hypothetical Protein FCC1311_045622 [Hondaea fermentalgiana]
MGASASIADGDEALVEIAQHLTPEAIQERPFYVLLCPDEVERDRVWAQAHALKYDRHVDGSVSVEEAATCARATAVTQALLDGQSNMETLQTLYNDFGSTNLADIFIGAVVSGTLKGAFDVNEVTASRAALAADLAMQMGLAFAAGSGPPGIAVAAGAVAFNVAAGVALNGMFGSEGNCAEVLVYDSCVTCRAYKGSDTLKFIPYWKERLGSCDGSLLISAGQRCSESFQVDLCVKGADGVLRLDTVHCHDLIFIATVQDDCTHVVWCKGSFSEPAQRGKTAIYKLKHGLSKRDMLSSSLSHGQEAMETLSKRIAEDLGAPAQRAFYSALRSVDAKVAMLTPQTICSSKSSAVAKELGDLIENIGSTSDVAGKAETVIEQAALVGKKIASGDLAQARDIITGVCAESQEAVSAGMTAAKAQAAAIPVTEMVQAQSANVSGLAVRTEGALQSTIEDCKKSYDAAKKSATTTADHIEKDIIPDALAKGEKMVNNLRDRISDVSKTQAEKFLKRTPKL